MPYIRIYLNGLLQQRVELNGDQLTIGRSSNNDIVINSPGVSAHHAIISRHGKSYLLEDIHSTNGLYVNGEQVKRHKLKYWDEIQIYNYVLRFMASAGLRGDSEDEEVFDPAPSDATLAFPVKGIDDLSRLRELSSKPCVQWLQDDGSENSLVLDDTVFSIGKDSECNLHTDHWFAPRFAANIENREQGFYLNPTRWGRVSLNGRKISAPARLHHNDIFHVAGLRLRFHHRASWSGMSA